MFLFLDQNDIGPKYNVATTLASFPKKKKEKEKCTKRIGNIRDKR
jgi:hypothetical protein